MNMLELRNMPQEGYRPSVAAILIECHPKHIYRLMHKGDIEYFLDHTGQMMVTKEAVFKYMKRKLYATKKSKA